MVILVEDLGKFLGKTAQTPYGIPVGKLVSVDTNIRNEVTQVSIDQTASELTKYSVAQVTIQNETVVIAPTWKHEMADLEREYLTATRRIGALKSLLSDGDIDNVTFREMTGEYESAIHAMESRRLALVDSLKEKCGKLDERIRALQLALTDNKLLYNSGVIETSAYKEACQCIHVMLDGHVAEKKDIQTTMETLAHLQRNESAMTYSKPEQIEQKIPDFVVVRVNEQTPA